MLRRDEHLHTPEQVRGYLTAGAQLMHESGHDPESYPEVFVAVINLLSQKQVFFEQAQVAGIDLGAMTPGWRQG